MSKSTNSIFVGKNNNPIWTKEIGGEFVKFNGEEYYRISNYNSMDPFFMTIVSHSDHWLFISSNGSLSAGRKNPDSSLFPYYTVDKIHDSADITGSKTILLVENDGHKYLWEPFSDRYKGVYNITRNLYKNTAGNKIVFEELNEDFNLTFRYSWNTSEAYGFVRNSELINNGTNQCTIDVLDGIQNILPFGVDRELQQTYSNLSDAYKKNELLTDTGIGLFMLSSIIVDKAEPSEALKANVVWSEGLQNAKHLISSRQLDNFRRGEGIQTEIDIRASRGAYFLNSEIHLEPMVAKSWYIIADLNKDAGDVALLRSKLTVGEITGHDIIKDIDKSSKLLLQILAKSDALQLTSDELSIKRHLSNVQFNVMRGGVFEKNYGLEKTDFLEFLRSANREIFKSHHLFFELLEGSMSYQKLMAQAENSESPQLVRLCLEYLPLSFSRRHGDPSRPWNRFSIDVKKEDGSKNLNYEGNWRDIFQNWEALSLSFPEYTESMITKFVNASTADGYNPYRITRNGIDWEVLEPDDPWSNIGYWGDHQIIYLLKLLEVSYDHNPDKLTSYLTTDHFCYANVPYRIKSYTQILSNPIDTIDFDDELEEQIQKRVQKIGSDGKLLWDKNAQVHQVNFSEKLLVTLLTKLSNFIPEAGIWLNTQRPEWNDANNALVGNGVSMVTLYQIRRFILFSSKLFKDSGLNSVLVAEEVNTLFESISMAFEMNSYLLTGNINNEDRKTIVDQLGNAGSTYRETIYTNGFSGQRAQVSLGYLNQFFSICLEHIDHTIRANKREDNLYHSYNLLHIENNSMSIRHLYEMLEGQVNVLASEILTPTEVVQLLDSLKGSKLYRPDQNSYILYPDRQLPRFDVKNNIPPDQIKKSSLLQRLLKNGDKSIAYQDVSGQYHFNGNFRNADDLKDALDQLEKTYQTGKSEKNQILDTFESVFDHKSFTGRSGSFFGFEGLGSIYWHMVSKLLLSVNECYYQALKENTDEETLGKIISHYYEIRAGIGLNKTPEVYGAFPTDAYSHTPGNAGAQQPGMTGQVKEDILARFGELGVFVSEGKVYFDSSLLRKEEFLKTTQEFNYYNIENDSKRIKVKANSLVFTYCQTPIIYSLSGHTEISVSMNSGEQVTLNGNVLTSEISKSLFERRNEIESIEVKLNPKLN